MTSRVYDFTRHGINESRRSKELFLVVSIICVVSICLVNTSAALSQPVWSIADAGNSCLGLDASPSDQLQRALSAENYAVCLRSLSKQQGGGCELPADVSLQSNQAWLDCMKQKGCGVNCQTRAIAFRSFAEVTQAYHLAKKRCEENAADVVACKNAEDTRNISLPQAAKSLSGEVSRGKF